MFSVVVSRERTADSFLCGVVRVAMRIRISVSTSGVLRNMALSEFILTLSMRNMAVEGLILSML